MCSCWPLCSFCCCQSNSPCEFCRSFWWVNVLKGIKYTIFFMIYSTAQLGDISVMFRRCLLSDSILRLFSRILSFEFLFQPSLSQNISVNVYPMFWLIKWKSQWLNCLLIFVGIDILIDFKSPLHWSLFFNDRQQGKSSRPSVFPIWAGQKVQVKKFEIKLKKKNSSNV